MPLHRSDFLLVNQVPQQGLELPRRRSCRGHVLGVLASAEEEVHLRGLGVVVDGADRGVVQRTIRLVGLHALVLVHGPQLRVLVLRARDHQHTVLRKVEARHRAAVGLDQFELLAVAGVPNDDGALLKNRNEGLVVGAPLHFRGLHGQLVVDAEKPLARAVLRVELPHHDPVRSGALRRCLEFVVACDDLILLARLLVELAKLQNPTMVEHAHLFTLEGVEDKLAVGTCCHDVLAIQGHVDGENGPRLFSRRRVGANALACVGAHEADLTVLRAGQEEIAVKVALHERDRALVDVEEVRVHGP
mmetsp:Transcript_53897/g.149893  ORF Transcript_53897/g.149893 Transcript_53897/m.149893 type:complete len:303 (+) Transcript_53897:298-1206(+)